MHILRPRPRPRPPSHNASAFRSISAYCQKLLMLLARGRPPCDSADTASSARCGLYVLHYGVFTVYSRCIYYITVHIYIPTKLCSNMSKSTPLALDNQYKMCRNTCTVASVPLCTKNARNVYLPLSLTIMGWYTQTLTNCTFML